METGQFTDDLPIPMVIFNSYDVKLPEGLWGFEHCSGGL